MLRFPVLSLKVFRLVFTLGLATATCFAQTADQPSPAPAAPAAAPEADSDSPDIPPMARDRITEEEYFRLRDQQLGMKRGITDLMSDPQARSRAVRTMQLQEQIIRQRMQLETSGTATGPLVPPSWTPLGPDPIPNGQTSGTEVPVSGRVTAIAVDPTDATGNTVYVGAAQGGLYRSLDGGATWTALLDSAQSLAIGAITIDPMNHTTVFVGTGESSLSLDSFFGVGVYIITNATTTPVVTGPFHTEAVTSNDIFTGRSISKILVNPANDNQILVSTSSGFSGASGDQFSTLPTRGVYLSTNALSGSPTFARLTIQTANANRLVSDMTIDPNNSNLVLVHVFGVAVAGDGGVWVSTSSPWTGTGTWQQTLIDNLGGNSADNGRFAANHVGSTTTFLLALDAGTNGTLSKSTDGGMTWTALPAANGFCGGQCFYDIAPAIDPTNANNIYLGGAAGTGIMRKSTDGGTTFPSSQSSLHADSHATAVAPGNPAVIYAGNDGGIFRSADSGATWSSINTIGFNATQFESIAVHPTDPNFTIGGTQDNGTEFQQPNGVWTRADFGDGGFSVIDQNAPDTTNVTMYHTYFNATNNLVGFAQVTSVATATEGNWNFFGCQGTTPGNGITCADAVLFYAPLALGPGNPNTVYYGTDRLYRSSNQGVLNSVVSQAPIVVGIPISAIGISPQDDNVRIVGLANGQVWATTSGSTTLTNVTGGWAAKYVARAVIDPNNSSTAYITLDGYGTPSHVWRTTNLNSATPVWVAASTGLPDVPVNGFVVDAFSSKLLYAGTDIGVYNSIDGGNTWNPYGSGLPRVAVFDLKITAGRKVRIATHGRGMWEIPAVNLLNTTTGLSSAPPNPTFGTQITLTAPVNIGSGVTPATGTVSFIENSTVLGTGPVAAGSASFQTSSLLVGAHSITAQYSGDSNYFASTSAPLVVNVGNAPNADYSLAIPNGSATIKAGNSAGYTINVSTVNGFGGTINFSCTTGVPSLANCSFTPPSVMVNNNTGSTMLTITTTAPTAAPPVQGLSSGLLTGGGFLAFGLVLATGLTSKKRRRSALMLFGLLSLAAVMISCGGGTPAVHNPGTPTGTFTVTVSATSGSTTHTSTVTLVVQ